MVDLFAPRAGAVVGAAFVDGVYKPVVERAVVLEFQGANRVRDSLDGIFESVRPVVHRVYAPFIAGAVMARVQDAIHDRVAHIQVRVRHIDFRPERS